MTVIDDIGPGIALCDECLIAYELGRTQGVTAYYQPLNFLPLAQAVRCSTCLVNSASKTVQANPQLLEAIRRAVLPQPKEPS